MAGRIRFRNARLLDPEAESPAVGELVVEGDRIVAVSRRAEEVPADAQAIDLGGRLLAPGFVDLHFHGAMVFAEPETAGEALRRDSAWLARHGVTAFLATTVAWPGTVLRRRVAALVEGLAKPQWPGARPIGIHLEGPWIRPEAAGAQPPAGIRPYEPAEGEAVFAGGSGWIRMVTFAPEIPGAGRLQEALGRHGVMAALGHTLADAETVRDAVVRGACHVTHLFNAMGSFHQRAPGVAGAALAEDGLSCDLICDGAHVHPDWVRVAVRAKGEKLILISDHVDPAASPEESSFGTGRFRDDGTAWRLPDGRLAGSRLSLDRAIRNVRSWGALELDEAVAACTLRPARLLGVEAERGTLRPGARADLVVLDSDTSVRETWVGGRRVWCS